MLCCILALANQLLERSGVYIRPLHAYLDDVLVMPLVLTIALAVERAYFSNPRFVLPRHYVWLALLLFSVVFEVILPPFSTAYTADVFDVGAYALGGLAFQYILNKPAGVTSR